MSSSSWITGYDRWMNYDQLEYKLRRLLVQLQNDEKTLEDCFYKNIEFGTGGIRGEMGPGTNRINIYTIRKVSEGLARYLIEHGEEAKQKGVVIAYDSRYNSATFAMEAAKVLGQNGIRIYLFNQLSPTPLLSFAVRHVGAFAGIVITASHNPPKDNGFKVYNQSGGQITLEAANQIMAHIQKVENELQIPFAQEDDLVQKGHLLTIGNEIRDTYLEQISKRRIVPQGMLSAMNQVKIVFTPFHGTSYETILQGFKLFGYENVSVVKEQAYPDPNFTNVVSPNPEDHRAFELAIQYGIRENADLVIGTDPDADRLGVAVKNEIGEFTVLTGNQIGALLLYYLLTIKHDLGLLASSGAVVKTVVTSEMGRAITSDFGLQTIDTLTGFKYIGEKINLFERTGEYVFQFGYEESNGYLFFDLVRDKDAIQAALVMADLCAHYKAQGKSVYDVLLLMYQKYGYYLEDLVSFHTQGADREKKSEAILAHFRSLPFTQIIDKKILAIEDYVSGERKDLRTGETLVLSLPQTNAIKIQLEEDIWFCIRPSGTESKIKLYFGVKGTSWNESKKVLEQLKEAVVKEIERL